MGTSPVDYKYHWNKELKDAFNKSAKELLF